MKFKSQAHYIYIQIATVPTNFSVSECTILTCAINKVVSLFTECCETQTLHVSFGADNRYANIFDLLKKAFYFST